MIVANKISSKISVGELEKIVGLARLAPSVHNSQPWRVRQTGYGLEAFIDDEHRLKAGDPTGRQTVISLGIFCQAIIIAAKNQDYRLRNISFKKDTAAIKFEKGQKTKTDIDRVNLLKSRATDRSIYSKCKINNELKKSILSAWKSNNVKVWLVDDQEFIDQLAEFTARGISIALSNPAFRRELRQYLVLPGSRKHRGISVKSLRLPYPIAVSQPTMLQYGIGTGKEAALEKKRWLSSSLVILITTKGDLHEDWFEAGRAYLEVSLRLEQLGLSQATSAATVEAATFHEDIEKMLGTNQRLQTVIRAGKGASKAQFSPRVTMQDLIT